MIYFVFNFNYLNNSKIANFLVFNINACRVRSNTRCSLCPRRYLQYSASYSCPYRGTRHHVLGLLFFLLRHGNLLCLLLCDRILGLHGMDVNAILVLNLANFCDLLYEVSYDLTGIGVDGGVIAVVHALVPLALDNKPKFASPSNKLTRIKVSQ